MNNKPLHLKSTSPRLTESLPHKSVTEFVCQACGRPHHHCPIDRGLTRWQEHDHFDQPEHRLVVLCRACSNKLIEPHVRLYRPLMANDPWPGCMAICLDCKHRDGVRCTHPNAKANGGAGVLVSIAEPSKAFVDGRGFHKLMEIWPSPATACREKEVA